MQKVQQGYDVLSLYTTSQSTETLTKVHEPRMAMMNVLSGFFVILGLTMVWQGLHIEGTHVGHTTVVMRTMVE